MCDGDDWWCDPLKLQRQVEALEADPACGLSYTRSERRFETTGERRRYPAGELFLRFRPAAVRQYGRELHGRRAAGADPALLRGGAAGRASRMADRRCADVDLVRGVQPHPASEEVTAVHRMLPESVSQSRAYRARIAFCDSLCDISLWFDARYGAGRHLRAASASDARGAVGVVARRYDGGSIFRAGGATCSARRCSCSMRRDTDCW